MNGESEEKGIKFVAVTFFNCEFLLNPRKNRESLVQKKVIFQLKT
jgi:hypothetical protein